MELQHSLTEITRLYNIPGLALCKIHSVDNCSIYTTGRTSKEETYKSREINQDTLFQLASVGKLLTAALVVEMEKAGILNLDKQFGIGSAGDKITISLRQLLQHRGGYIDNYGFTGRSIYQDCRKNQAYYSNYCSKNFCIDYINKFHYSGCGYWRIQNYIENITGISFEELLNKWICKPLNMHRTSSVIPDFLDMNVTDAHDASGNKICRTEKSFQCVEAAAGIWSTSNDMTKFVHFMLYGDDNNSLRISLKDLLIKNKKEGYHLGVIAKFKNNEFIVSHNGINPGSCASVSFNITKGTACIVLANKHNVNILSSLFS